MNSENKEFELCLDVIHFLFIVTTYLLIPILNYGDIIEIDKNVINKDEFTYNEKITINMMNNEQMFNLNLRAEVIINRDSFERVFLLLKNGIFHSVS